MPQTQAQIEYGRRRTEASRAAKANFELPVHFFIPDTQVRPGVLTNHLEWVGQYFHDEYSDHVTTVIQIGDHWDMASLSSYDRGKAKMEGRRYVKDVDAGNKAFELLDSYLTGAAQKHFFFGNHEDRITRACEADAQLDGLLSLESLDTRDWVRHPFLEPSNLDGVLYAHYFYAPMSGRPYSGANLETRLKQVLTSFSMGHQQGLKWSRVDTIRGPLIGLVAGSCYLHDEEYKGPQANNHWRGIVLCHQVENGGYDPMMVSLDYLCRRYENMRLADFRERYGC